MKGFGIEIKNNLLDPKHIKQMGVAVWLYMFFIDKMTSIGEDGIGKVLGGKPIKFSEDIEPELGVSERTYFRWIETLREQGYINTIQTPYGLSVSVNKAYKHFGKKIERPAISGNSDLPKVAEPPATNGSSNKTEQRHSSKTEREAQAPPTQNFFEDINLQKGVLDMLVGKGIDPVLAQTELKKFINYWTEPNKSGTKVRWQGERFFDIKRRLATWFSNVSKFQGRTQTKGKGIFV